jgi:hypothetical protein
LRKLRGVVVFIVGFYFCHSEGSGGISCWGGGEE